jgi:hypothetical protein
MFPACKTRRVPRTEWAATGPLRPAAATTVIDRGRTWPETDDPDGGARTADPAGPDESGQAGGADQ